LPTHTAAEPTATASSDPATPAAIVDLVEAMEAAIIDGDVEVYMALVSPADPIFATEHRRWADDWAANPPDDLSLSVAEVAVADDPSLDGVLRMNGVLTIAWSAGGQPARSANLDVQFSQADETAWLYAGERWVTEELDRFRVRVAPGLEGALPPIVEDLPAIYSHVTDELGHEPETRMEIKVYNDGPSLVATVQLGLPDIHGWNEPGEALKVRLDPAVPSLTPTIAHEFTHFLVFDRAGTQRPRMPWWLEEGLATYVAGEFTDPEVLETRMAQVRSWAAAGELADWSDISDFNTTPQELWPFVYSQGYAMVRYLSETYPDERNPWLDAMSTEMDIGQATESQLGLSFDQLASDFEDWLAEGTGA
jgi:hypothetical protein